MIEALLLVIFIIAFVVTVYIYFGYPALLLIIARIRSRPVRRAAITPSISIIVPLFNEEAVVEQKVLNTLELDYPAENLEVLFVSDGSTDRSEEIVRRYESERMRLLALPRGGKAAALNAGAVAASGEILVLTDANVILSRDALRVIASAYADPDVGGVSGKKKALIRIGSDTTEQGENLYWKWDQWQKELESAIGSIFAADGTLYSLRRSLYVPIDDPAQADDIAISTRVVLQGKRLIFDPAAIAYEEAPAEGAGEFRRKVRVTNHSVRALLNLGSALWSSGFYSVELLSHKLVRHLVPFFLIAMFAANIPLALIRPAPFALILVGQVLFYGLASIGWMLREAPGGKTKLLAVPYYFCLVNAAAFFGVLSAMRGRRVHQWAPRSS